MGITFKFNCTTNICNFYFLSFSFLCEIQNGKMLLYLNIEFIRHFIETRVLNGLPFSKKKKTIHCSDVYCNTLWDCLYCFKNHYMTCDLYFQLLLCNYSLKVMSVMHCNKAHIIIIPFTIHIILLKLASFRNQPMDLLRKRTDWFLNDTKFYRLVIFEHTIIDVWSILN